MKRVYANFFRHRNKIALILELASSNIMLFLLTPQIKNTLLSRQITIPATAEHAHCMAYVKHLLKQHTYETDESAPLCDNNDVTHKNTCECNYHVCQTQEEPGIKHYGGCKRESLPVLCDWISCRKISRNQECLRKINLKITGTFILSSSTASLTREKNNSCLYLTQIKQHKKNSTLQVHGIL